MRHEALLYHDVSEYLVGTRAFVDEGLAAGERVAVAVPAPNAGALRVDLGPAAERVRFVDMGEVGRNPGRLLPFIDDWIDAHEGRPVRFVGEPIWPARRPSEAVEAARHEHLINHAFAGTRAAILCPYDAARLAPDVLAEAERTHPAIVCGGRTDPSPAFAGATAAAEVLADALPPPAGDVTTVPVTDDLTGLRRIVAAWAAEAGIDRTRLPDLLLATTEAATNTLVHGGRDGVVDLWTEGGHVVVQVTDSGRIEDPLVGRRRPSPHAPGGRGLWLVHQLCDLVQLRSTEGRTTVRVSMLAG